jgi:hypothetical protein
MVSTFSISTCHKINHTAAAILVSELESLLLDLVQLLQVVSDLMLVVVQRHFEMYLDRGEQIVGEKARHIRQLEQVSNLILWNRLARVEHAKDHVGQHNSVLGAFGHVDTPQRGRNAIHCPPACHPRRVWTHTPPFLTPPQNHSNSWTKQLY